MKFFILLATLVVVTTSTLTPEQEQLFENYVITFNIRFGRSDNIEERKQRFIENYNEVEAHNAGNFSYTAAINSFAHLNENELMQRTGYIYNPEDRENATEFIQGRNARALPSGWDWRNRSGVVRPVQNQGGCGSCWAFAAIGAIEGQMSIKKNSSSKLSEQEVVECARSSTGVLRGCTGGWDSLAYLHSKSNQGITNSTWNPYVASTTGRNCNIGRPRTPGSTVSTWSYIAQNEATIRDVLYNNGPLYVIYHVANNFFNYGSGIYTDIGNQCANNTPNHAVLLVGFGTELGVDFWILKNSWGTGWGERGYFRMRRGINLCKITAGVSIPTLA